MSDIWLLDSLPSSACVTERHEMSIDLGDNPSLESKQGQIDVKVTVPLDGHQYVRRDTLTRAIAARDAGGVGRLGIFGFAAATHRPKTDLPGGSKRAITITTAFKPAEMDSSKPLYLAGDGSLVSWALDLPDAVELDLSSRPPEAPEQVCTYRLTLPLAPPELHPVTLDAFLAIHGDDLPRALVELNNLPGSGDSAQALAAGRVIDALAQLPSQSSVFQVALGAEVAPAANTEMERPRLRRISLDWPAGGGGDDIVLVSFKGRGFPGRYDPATGKVEFPTLALAAEQEFNAIGPGSLSLRLQIQNSGVLSAMAPLTGTIEITLDRLASGVRPFMSDISGNVVAGLGMEDRTNITERTIIRSAFRIDLKALFRDRLVAQHVRLQFPGRRFSDDQLRQLKTIFRNFQFSGPEQFPPASSLEQSRLEDGRTSWLLYGSHLVGGKRQYLVFHIAPTRRSVTREVQGRSGTEIRQDLVDDIAVDLAVVGPDHRALSALLADLRGSIVSVLGTA
jgi:hypothetical protein